MQALVPRGIDRREREVIGPPTCEVADGIARDVPNRDRRAIDPRLGSHVDIVSGDVGLRIGIPGECCRAGGGWRRQRERDGNGLRTIG